MTIIDPPKTLPAPPGRPQSVAGILAAAGEADAAAFAVPCLAQVPPEDLTPYDDAALAAAVRAFFAFAKQRPETVRKIRVYNPSTGTDGYGCANTVIETVGTDTPFILDSCLAMLNARGLSIKALWHPVVTVQRDKIGTRQIQGEALETIHESMIRIEIDRIEAQATFESLKAELLHVFADVATAVADWRGMLARIDESKDELRLRPPPLEPEAQEEALAFLSWLRNEHFTLLGCRDYALRPRNGDEVLEPLHETGLGLLRDPERRIVRRGVDRSTLSPELRAFINEPAPLIITKTNTRSTVHRRVHMDYIGIKRFDETGKVIGERRFIGLFTSTAYTRELSGIPYLRQKAARVQARAAFDPRSHDGRALAHILETYPRDELFQIEEDTLYETALGILRLRERPRTRIFLRWDKFDRFVSVLVFMPRESYSTAVRIRIMAILTQHLDGRPTAYNPSFGDETLARVHYIIGRNEGARPEFDHDALEAQIAAAARSWDEEFEEAATSAFGEEAGTALYSGWRSAFGAGFREAFSPKDALTDIAVMDNADAAPLHVRLFRDASDAPSTLRLKLYHRGAPLVLSDILPILEKLGLKVIFEQSYPVLRLQRVYIHEFRAEEPRGRALDIATLQKPFAEAFTAIWTGRAESDGLNRLILDAGLDWRNVTILRAIGRFLRQAAISYSRDYMEDALFTHGAIAALIVRLFQARFDPALKGDRDATQGKIREEIETALGEVNVLDEDRILRRFADTVSAMLRTNYYQDKLSGDEPVLSFKIESRKLVDLPAPRPFAEIFIYSPRVEGVHLRFGKVARGGIRWSDRREDFRTEILGLVKAQRVKNAVIVPVGAKGGFFPKQMPADASREVMQTEGTACYKIFISALLALTDNIEDGKVVPPADTVRHDDDDPYLVVAADKGTASFSDIANEIALSRGFWLGDAFASGGSEGYDHKKMGITARGAWEAVKRHFREIGTDIQTQPFTVIGVGDMSGDVFGNAMLLSQQTKLLAAFDHRDIFIDPDPDTQKSHAERVRLFALPRSSWADYDKELISKGGGVFSRKLKSIPLSPEMQKLTRLSVKSAAPQDLIRALLKAKVDLLFFGGIGTFIKAAGESNLDVGDRANDALRIDGAEVGAKVVGEGANLGCTQLGRVEYAHAGGRINTDAIDNSAGVDTSDHEVNIKILLDAERRAGHLSPQERHSLLNAMGPEISRLVLETNYAQTRALSISEATASRDLSRHARFIDSLEREDLLDRKLERLPDAEGFRALETKGAGLTRPELAVLLAYAKLTVFEKILHGGVPDDPYFARELHAYFPKQIAQRFAEGIQAHRLRREIIATRLANALVNMTGPTFAFNLSEESERPQADVVRAYAIAHEISGAENLRAQIDALDLKVTASLQTELHIRLRNYMQQQSIWLLKHGPRPLDVEQAVMRYKQGVALITTALLRFATPAVKAQIDTVERNFKAHGVPDGLAHDIAMLELYVQSGDIVGVAEAAHKPAETAARALFTIAEALALDRLDTLANDMKLDSYWDNVARMRMSDAIAGHKRAMAIKALSGASGEGVSGEAAAMAYLEHHKGSEGVAKMIAEFEQSGLTIGKLSILESSLGSFAAE